MAFTGSARRFTELGAILLNTYRIFAPLAVQALAGELEQAARQGRVALLPAQDGCAIDPKGPAGVVLRPVAPPAPFLELLRCHAVNIEC